jgi:hypothetical protein
MFNWAMLFFSQLHAAPLAGPPSTPPEKLVRSHSWWLVGVEKWTCEMLSKPSHTSNTVTFTCPTPSSNSYGAGRLDAQWYTWCVQKGPHDTSRFEFPSSDGALATSETSPKLCPYYPNVVNPSVIIMNRLCVTWGKHSYYIASSYGRKEESHPPTGLNKSIASPFDNLHGSEESPDSEDCPFRLAQDTGNHPVQNGSGVNSMCEVFEASCVGFFAHLTV